MKSLAPPPTEARHLLRADLRCAATLVMLDETRIEGETVDLSAGGVSVRLAQRLPLAVLCAVRFEAGAKDSYVPLSAIGQIVYVEEDGGAWRTGVKFLQLDAEARETIARLLSPD